MTTGTPHLNRHLHRFLATAAILLAGATATLVSAPGTGIAQTAQLPTYGWPIKPFNVQHPVRGSFGDPRIGGKSRSFHFGVDVSCPDGTPVYATVTGHVYLSARHPETVSVIADHGNVVFGYWHIVPSVHAGQRVIAYRSVIGKVAAGWEHVHFAEHRNGTYVNPLRSGAMGPFTDHTVPAVRSLTVAAAGAPVRRTAVHGRVDLIAEAYDETPVPIAGAWHGKPLTPALIEWRLKHQGRNVTGWRTAVDFRLTYPSNTLFNRTYASWTRQNKRIWDARYGFYLTHDLDTRRLHDGSYDLEIRATDERGNVGTRSFTLTVVNAL
jgi:murein DD-endopeptidase MepM/ murein hydrolase activator NlpD